MTSSCGERFPVPTDVLSCKIRKVDIHPEKHGKILIRYLVGPIEFIYMYIFR